MSKRKFWFFTDSSADMTEQYYAENGEPIFITHGDCLEDAEYLKSILEKKYPENPVSINYVAVIGAHSGVGTLALFYRGSNREAKQST